MIYEPESFTPLLQLQQPTDTPASEQDKVLAEVMGSLQSTLDYLPAHEAYELSRSVREQTIAQLKANEQWQTPQLPDECYFYHCNHLGLPEALTDTNGEAVWAASYDAWGNVKEEHNPNNLHQPIRLPGQYHDLETNLHYNRHRYYDPKLGNYINQDPIGLSSGEPNLTVYPRNPIQEIDPHGLWAWGDPISDEVVNAVAGFGDGIFQVATFGFGDLENVREMLGSGGTVDKDSGEYIFGWGAGLFYAAAIPFAPKGCVLGSKTQQVAQWGPRGNNAGLYPGAWVMTGSNKNPINYLMSGTLSLKKKYPFKEGVTSTVLKKSDLTWPKGWQKYKGLLGQRQYNPKL